MKDTAIALGGFGTDSRGGVVEFREASNLEELEALFRFRYHMFRASKLRGFVPETSEGLHLEFFDLRSHHLGLFLRDPSGERIVGYERVVVESPGPSHDEVWRLSERYPSLGVALLDDPGVPLPSLTYAHSENLGPLREFCALRERAGRIICESSRTCIDPQFRSLSIGWWLVEAAMAFGLFTNVSDTAIMHAATHHRRFYERVGWRVVPGTVDRFCPQAEVQANCMYLSREMVPCKLEARLRDLAAQMESSCRMSIPWDQAA